MELQFVLNSSLTKSTKLSLYPLTKNKNDLYWFSHCHSLFKILRSTNKQNMMFIKTNEITAVCTSNDTLNKHVYL